jgi:hypothetical protein
MNNPNAINAQMHCGAVMRIASRTVIAWTHQWFKDLAEMDQPINPTIWE